MNRKQAMRAFLRRVFQESFRLLNILSRNRIVRLLVTLLILGFGVVAIFSYSQQITTGIKQIHFNGWWMAGAWLITWLVVWTGAVAWWLLMLGFQQPADPLDSWRVHLRSAIARYLPGYAWQYLGKAYMTGQMGVPARVISTLLVWELVQLLWTGAGLGFLFFPGMVTQEWGLPAWVSPTLSILGGGMLVGALLFPFAATRLSSRGPLRGLLAGLTVRAKYLALSELVILLNWLALGLALWMTIASFGYPRPGDFLVFLSSFAVSMVLGVLAIPVPNGIGVREGAMSYLLSHFIPLPVALLSAALCRLQVITGEFFCVLLVDFTRQIRARIGRANALKSFSGRNTPNGLDQ